TAAFILVGIFAFSRTSPQESSDKKGSRVVFQLSTPDTAAHRALARQLNNLLEGLPNAQVEVVVHNKGISMLHAQKTTLATELQGLKDRGVKFVACEQTLKQQKMEKSEILPLAGFVPRGLVEIIQKQEKGWSYIKAGF
ncbi:MAG: DsrE family protein, partial [Saprospiraceae bacterium]|nr:DsrE family protein [Saprospiraceae bacterium]